MNDEEKTTEDADNSAKDVDSEENSSNLAKSVSEVGSLIGDSAKSVFDEGVSTITQPSDEKSDDANSSEPFSSVEQSNDVDEWKNQIETLKQEKSELKNKLIDKLEQENETLKQGTQQPDNTFGEQEQPGSLDLSDESTNNENMYVSSPEKSEENNLSQEETGTGSVEGSEENNALVKSQKNSDGSFTTIDINSNAESNSTDNESPDLGSDISPIKLEKSESDTTPIGGTKHKRKKQRKTRRKKH